MSSPEQESPAVDDDVKTADLTTAELHDAVTGSALENTHLGDRRLVPLLTASSCDVEMAPMHGNGNNHVGCRRDSSQDAEPAPMHMHGNGNNHVGCGHDYSQDQDGGGAQEDDDPDLETITITVAHHGNTIPLIFLETDTISDLSAVVATDLSIPSSNQKFLIPGSGLHRPPFRNPTLALSTLPPNKSIKLLGEPTTTYEDLNANLSKLKDRLAARRNRPKVLPTRTRPNQQDAAATSQYTFHTIRPLPYLADPPASLRYLQRLAADAGIIAAMRKHRFSVGLLTEMNPAEHTTHAGRTLGLNRNHGEVIELRLRTDDDQGYRNYRTVRRTLCHELAHNVYGPHDEKFWTLFRQIEREVERGDWRSGGRTVAGSGVAFAPERNDEEDEEHVDGGGWTGGEFVLGGGPGGAGGGLSRRDVLAQAAEERAKAAKRARDGDGANNGV